MIQKLMKTGLKKLRCFVVGMTTKKWILDDRQSAFGLEGFAEDRIKKLETQNRKRSNTHRHAHTHIHTHIRHLALPSSESAKVKKSFRLDQPVS
jgi:hypothetical protein